MARIERLAGQSSRVSRNRRRLEREALIYVSVALVLLFLSLFYNKSKKIDALAYLNLNDLPNTQVVEQALAGVYPNKEDRRLAAESIFEQSRLTPLPNAGALNRIAIDAQRAELRGGTYFDERVQLSQESIGFKGDFYQQERKNPKALPAVSSHNLGDVRLKGFLKDPTGKPFANTLVTLQSDQISDTVRTDITGMFQFSGLTSNTTYRLLPLKPTFEFKAQRFTTSNTNIQFQGAVHTIRLLDPTHFRQIKPLVAVRSAADFYQQFILTLLGFFGIFWLVHFIWTYRKFNGDAFILPLVMFLSGIGLAMMFSIPDPLRDMPRGFDSAQGIISGAILLLIFSFLDIQRFGYETAEKGNRSFAWLGLAALLSFILIVFGQGPEGSDAKVNIPLFLFVGPLIQPVELIKTCLLMFFAGYLAHNWQFLRELDANVPNWMQKLRVRIPELGYLLPIVGGVAISLIFFFVQSDLGPALIICTTFLAMYGIVRKHWIGVFGGFAGLIGGFWLMYLLFPRVGARIKMWLYPWDNDAFGGSHLAHSFWGMASGGWLGLGLGDGNPNFMPSAHTDLVISAVGEEMGFWGVLLVLGLYGFLFLRGIWIARNAETRFGFFLATGITLSSFIQLFLITGGTFGILPLSGVVAPFMSYGKVSVVLHFIFMGILLQLSAKVHDNQSIKEDFKTPMRVAEWAVFACLSLLALRAAWVQLVKADEWAIKPTLVRQGDGFRGFEYNPRVLSIRDKLPIGTIYDRNGIPIATSDSTLIRKFSKDYKKIGIQIPAPSAERGYRYYPFKSLLFYMLGDWNSRVKWNAPNALYAENRYLSLLRGYSNRPQDYIINDTKRDTSYAGTWYDYSPLLPFLRHEADSTNMNKYLNKNRDIYMTLDVALQQKMAEDVQFKAKSMGLRPNQRIAAAVIHAASGDILATLNFPLPTQVYSDIADSIDAARSNRSLFDRAVYADKAPGSSAKIVTALALFQKLGDEAKNVTEQVTGNRRTEVGYRRGEPLGRVNLQQAIVHSSNIFFAKASADKIGPQTMADLFTLFEITVQNPIFNREEKIQALYQNKNLWQAGFGQGNIVASPLQIARAAATIANNGLYMPTRWLKSESNTPVRVVNASQAQFLQEAMRGVVTRGTGKQAATSPFKISGKTGTAEQDKHPDHKWFVSFVPDGKGSHLALCVVVMDNGNTRSSPAIALTETILQSAKATGWIR